MTLLEQIGGHSAVETVTKSLYARILADDKLAPFFEGMNVERQQSKMVGFLAAALGGHAYIGRGLKEAHAHLAITHDDFSRVASCLSLALLDAGVSKEQHDAVMALAGSLVNDVVTMPAPDRIMWLLQQTEDEHAAVVDHDLYAEVTTEEQLANFMRYHVYAVWDFMSLLKALQHHVTCVEVPWVPKGGAKARRLVNSIVLDEESDLLPDGPVSHFELYLLAMQDVGADTSTVIRFVNEIRAGHLVSVALERAGVPLGARDFVLTTMDIVSQNKPHAIAAAFTLGREDAIPDMFRRLLAAIPEAPRMKHYLERHIDLDGDTHSKQGFELIEELCGYDMAKWQEAAAASKQALAARARLWSAIAGAL